MTDEPATPAPIPADPTASPQQPLPDAKPTPKRRRRRWPYVILGLLLVLVLLVVFAPTIASSGPVRAMVMSKVNANLNGRVEVASFSAGWTSGIKVEGVRVFDAQNAQILQLKSLTTELTLMDAVRGQLHLGKVTVDGLNALVKSDSEGNLNFAKLVKESPQPPKEQHPKTEPKAPKADEPTKLPDVSGELHLVNCSATYEDGRSASIGGTGQTFYFPSIAGVVKFPDINKTIEDAIDIAVKVGDGQPGKIALAGTADIAENNVLQLDKAAIDQTLTTQDIRLESFSFALGKDGGIQKLAGLTNGKVVVKVLPSGDATLDVALRSQDLAVGGPALKGGTYQTKSLDIVVPNVVVNRSADPNDYTKWAIKAGSNQQPVSVKFDQGSVTLAADAPVGALLNAAANKAPGAAGFVKTNLDVNVGELAKQLPGIFAVKEGLTITGGRLRQATDIALAPDRADIKTLTVDLIDVAGIDATRNNAAVALQPIHLALNATSLGGGGAIPDLRDLKLTIQSAFADGTIQGRSIAETNGTLSADLRRAREELAKVIDLGTLQLDGKLVLGLGSKGDLLAQNVAERKATFGVSLHGDGLKVSGIEGTQPVDVRLLRLDVAATAFGGQASFVQHLEDLKLTAVVGDEANPTVVAELTGKRVDLPAGSAPATAPTAVSVASTAPSGATAVGMELKRLTVQLAQAQREFGAFVPALKQQGLDFSSGTLSVAGSGNYDGKSANYGSRVSLAGVNLSKTPEPAPGAAASGPRPVLTNYTATIDAAGRYAAMPNDQAQLTLSTLNVDGKFIAVAKAGNRDISLTTGPGGLTPSIDVTLVADLKQINDLLTALSDEPVQVVVRNHQPGGLRSGKITGGLQLEPVDGQQFRIATRDLKLTDLTVTGESGAAALTNETFAIDLQARPKADFSAIDIDRLTVDGKLANVSADKAQIVLTIGTGNLGRPAAVPEMVQSATAKVDVHDLGGIQSLMDAFAPPAPATSTALAAPLPEALAQAGRIDPNAVTARPGRSNAVQPASPPSGKAAAPTPPTRFGGGTLTLNLNVARAGEKTNVTADVSGKNVQLLKGPARDTISELSLATQLSYVPVTTPVTKATVAKATAPAAPAASQPSVLESLRDVHVAKLDVNVVRAGANVPVVRLGLVEPLVVSQPAALGEFFSSLSDPKASKPGEVATLRTSLKGGGDLGELMALLKVLSADASTDRPYAGTYSLDQKVTAGREGLAATGSINVADLSVKGTSGTFMEKSVKLANDVSLDAGQQLLSIRNVSLAMEATRALELALKGNVKDLSASRTLDGVSGTIGYDWAKVWQIVEPMLDPATRKDLKLTLVGKGSKPFSLAGSYPANKPFNEAIRSVIGSFEVAFDQLNYNEIDTRNLALPITLKDGSATIAYANKPAGANLPEAAPCNGGFIRLGGASVDLTGDLMRLNIPKGTKVLEKVQLNPYFSNSFGNLINNPAFVDASRASGTVNLTIVECTGFPLAKLDPAAAQRDPGRAELLFSMSQLQLGNPMINQVADAAGKFLKVGQLNEKSLQGEIKEAHVILEHGKSTQDVTIATGERGRELRLAGSADLITTKLMGMNLFVGPQFLEQMFGEKVAAQYPKGFPLALTGDLRGVKIDVNRAITELVGNPLTDPSRIGDLIGSFGKGRDDKKKPDAGNSASNGAAGNPGGTAPPPAQAKDPEEELIGTIGGLLGGKKETDKEKEERRARNRRERELEQQRLQQEKAAAATRPATQPATKPATPEKKPKKK
jgi:hypothetical protein